MCTAGEKRGSPAPSAFPRMWGAARSVLRNMFCVLFVALRRKPPSRWRLLLRSVRCLWSLRSRSRHGGSPRFALRPPCRSALVFSVSPPAPPPPCSAGRYAPRFAREGGACALRLGGRPDPPAPLACRPACRYAPRRAAGFPPPPPRRRLRAKFIRGLDRGLFVACSWLNHTKKGASAP